MFNYYQLKQMQLKGGDLSPPKPTNPKWDYDDKRVNQDSNARLGQRPYWQWGFSTDEVREYDNKRTLRMLRNQGILDTLDETRRDIQATADDRRQQLRAVVAVRAAAVGMHPVSYCKAFGLRAALYLHEQRGCVL